MKSNINKIDIGKLVPQEGGFSAFIPAPFPPEEDIVCSNMLHKKHAEAARLIGKLDGVTRFLPDKDFFLYMFVTKDAAYSSQIEGTQATMQDAVAAPVTESASQPHPDVDDITHYIEAVNYGMERVKELPLSLRLIREVHERLMKGARVTQHAYPGEFRRSQNWIGGKTPSDARFVPPPVEEMHTALHNLEQFIHAPDTYPPLIKAGLIHAQFETIHPFTDGNGRTGRMLVALYLHHIQLLELPVLYLSHYFKKHQKLYYEKLNAYHENPSEIEGWLSFFLEGVSEIAQSSIDTCTKIAEIRERDYEKLHKLGKASAESAFIVIRQLYRQPIVGIAEVVKWTGFSLQGAYNVIDRLVDLGILEPLGNTAYDQKYIYADYYELFDDTFRQERLTKKS